MTPIIRPLNSKILKCLKNKDILIFYDLESYGKEKRQKNHYQYRVNTLNEVKDHIKKHSTKNLLVRTDNPSSPYFLRQILFLQKNKVDNIMIPYFKNLVDLKILIKININPKKIIYLFETIQSLNKIEKFIKIYKIDRCYIGLNDLSISLGSKLPQDTARLFFSSLITEKCNYLKKNNIIFGVGGISFFNDENLLFKPKIIKKRFLELGSKFVLMSSNFYKKISNLKDVTKIDYFIKKNIKFLKYK